MKATLPFEADLIEEHIEHLATILDKHALSHIEYSINDIRIEIARTGAATANGDQQAEALQHIATSATWSAAPIPETPATGAPASASPASEISAPQASVSEESTPAATGSDSTDHSTDGHIVYAPLVGVAYRSKEPDAPPFVTIDDVVEEGTTLCLIEAMKMFNEIKAPHAGTISEIHFEDTALVEHGAPLFTIV